MIHTGICNGFGFDEGSGPYLVVDQQGIHDIHWTRTYALLRHTTVDVTPLSQQYCTGYCKLSKNVTQPCPQRKTISARFKVCWHCFKLTGFSPAFYNLAKSELSNAQLRYNNLPHYVYLAAFGEDCFKVGIACHMRLFQRLAEQGARLATVIALLPDAYQARKMEETIQHVYLIPDRVTKKKK
ncbi:MAG: DUF2797 domain-containing protein [Bacteroidota bacterium]